MLPDLTDHIDYLNTRIKAIEKEIQEFMDQTPDLKSQKDLLISIPGIGNTTAVKLLAEIGDISAFKDAPQLAAYAGLNPKGFRSGSSSIRKHVYPNKEGLYYDAAFTCQPLWPCHIILLLQMALSTGYQKGAYPRWQLWQRLCGNFSILLMES